MHTGIKRRNGKGKSMDMEEKTLEVIHLIREKIQDKTYPYGSTIPSERELAQSFNVSRNLIRCAVNSLIDENLLKRVHGKGTYVTKTDIDDTAIHFKGMSELLNEAGFKPSSKVLTTQTREAKFKYSNIFHVEEHTKMFQIIRLRLGNNLPISIENTTIPYESIKHIEDIDFQVYSLYDMFAINGISIQNIEHIFSSTRIHGAYAKLLNKEEDTPIVNIKITSYIKTHQIAEYTEVIVVPEFSKYYTDGIIKNGIFNLTSQLIT